MHPLIGSIALGGAVVLISLAFVNDRLTRDLSKKAATAGAVSAAGQDSISASADVVRAMGMTSAFLLQFEDARSQASLPQLQGSKASGRMSGLIRFLRLFLQSIALGAGAWLAIDKQISAGAIFASSMLAARALTPIDQIVAQWRALSGAATSYDALREHLSLAVAAPITTLPAPRARLSLQRVGVLSPARDRLLLNGATFDVGEGAAVAVIGPSGAGKSTLQQVIANARVADQGEVRIDGARYADWDTERLGRFIGYLPQDSALFPGSVKDNISRFDRWNGANDDVVDAMAVTAAKAAEAHEMILKLPQGYDTMLGQRGRGLSAGQQQRVALARALYGEPRLYVLDEPNSNADQEAELALLQVVNRLKATGAIVIIAAHRLSLIGAVDYIAVVREGRVDRFGPRDEIIALLRKAEAAAAAPAVQDS